MTIFFKKHRGCATCLVDWWDAHLRRRKRWIRKTRLWGTRRRSWTNRTQKMDLSMGRAKWSIYRWFLLLRLLKCFIYARYSYVFSMFLIYDHVTVKHWEYVVDALNIDIGIYCRTCFMFPAHFVLYRILPYITKYRPWLVATIGLKFWICLLVWWIGV